jgi:hypothetical protein
MVVCKNKKKEGKNNNNNIKKNTSLKGYGIKVRSNALFFIIVSM